jgi:uncharacterized membrane protein YgaE (UPF0421/DUF939 family)
MFDKLAIYVIIGLLVAGAFGTMYTKNQVLKNEVLKISIERDNLKSAYKVKELEFQNSKETQKTLQNLLAKEKEASQRLEDELGIIRNEPETDNGDVSPLLRRGISRLHDGNKV